MVLAEGIRATCTGRPNAHVHQGSAGGRVEERGAGGGGEGGGGVKGGGRERGGGGGGGCHGSCACGRCW
jgi:hypothetical protein